MGLTARFLGLAGVFLFLLLLGISYGSTGLRWPLEGAVGALRLQRSLAAAGVGVLLAAAGALIQYSVGNPLAEPSLLGMPQAGILVVAALLLLGSPPPGGALAAAAAGSLAGYAASLALASRLGLTGPGLIVAGVAVSSLATGAGMLLLLLAEAKLGVPGYAILFGSFAYATRGDAVLASLSSLLVAAASLLMSRGLDALSYGDDVAAAAGWSPGRLRLAATGLAAAATAVSINVAGVIGFVGLIAPNAARLLLGGRPAVALPGALLLGGSVALGADLFSRLSSGLLGLGELPAGAGTSLLGGAFLAYMAARPGRAWTATGY